MEDTNTNKKSEAALREEHILEFWQENKIFEKSVNKKAPKGKYVFYDGPPFATGVPHYGHILGSTAKDVIGRYQTMRGFSVPRRWGWDCHGLPIENIVEKELNISGKKAIEEFGIDNFVKHARSKVLTYVVEWEKTINRIGRWVDFDNSYRTMDNTFIESVWWALGELNKKGLLYEGVKVLAYCPRCETPIANSEIAMDNSYKDITDISVYVKFKLKPGQKFGKDRETKDSAYLLAWTTTPWTLPGNTAIAINKNINYTALRIKGIPELLIVASDCIKNVFKDKEIEIAHDDMKGGDLVGLSYEPVFSYYKNVEMPNKENIWKVWHADFVTLEKGTGIAHEAPAFGEDDMVLSKKHNIPFIRHVEPNGVFTKEVVDFAGIKVKPKEDHQSADILIIKHLAHENKLFAKEKIIHPYPHCYRCETPLLYYALPSWFVNIGKVKSEMLENAKTMNWVPAHLKDGRFKNTMESAPDWTISRNRYWASPLPFWKSASLKVMFISGVEDLKSKTKKSGNKYFVMRHGEAENNALQIVSSKINNTHHLTEKGKKQVLESAKFLVDKKIDLVFSSPFLRTTETAEMIAKIINFPPQNIIKDLRIAELNEGIFSESKEEEVRNFFIKNNLDKYSGACPEGESLIDLKKRTGEFIYEIDRKYQNKNILIITHEDASWAMISAVFSLNKEETLATEESRLKNAEIREFIFVSLPHNENFELDLHRPYIDDIVLVDEKGEEYYRTKEVVDCWFESGSMPFAQDHYPFENKNWQKENFPSGFVAEYIAQTRTWFYYTHTISSILFNHAPFQNVVTTGTILAEDGQKMSKSKNNFPDPHLLFNKYGVDALRFYLMSCPVMKGEDINFKEELVQEISNKIIGRLFNVFSFYELYRDVSLEFEINNFKSSNVLDIWILSRFNETTKEVSVGMEKYDMALATRPFELFIEDLSTWYLRRSRDRIKDKDEEAKKTLYYILKNLVKIMAPFTPFIAEEIWLKLKDENDEESVHLSKWPEVKKSTKLFAFLNFDLKQNKKVLENMDMVRNIVSLGLEARQKAKIQVRQPLNQLQIKNYELGIEYVELMKDELNVKEIIFDNSIDSEVVLDIGITPLLKQEGNYRELVRALQDMRKKMGLTPSDVVSLTFETSDEGKNLIQKFENDMKKTVLALKIEFKNNDGEEIKIDELVFKIKIEKI
ncbi:MAG: class I tRNA ligase family protein [Candidatus Paceibacterota bacterium]